MKHPVWLCLLVVLGVFTALARGDGKATPKVRKDKRFVDLDKAEFTAGEKRKALTTATDCDLTWKPGQWHHIERREG